MVDKRRYRTIGHQKDDGRRRGRRRDFMLAVLGSQSSSDKGRG